MIWKFNPICNLLQCDYLKRLLDISCIMPTLWGLNAFWIPIAYIINLHLISTLLLLKCQFIVHKVIEGANLGHGSIQFSQHLSKPPKKKKKKSIIIIITV